MWSKLIVVCFVLLACAIVSQAAEDGEEGWDSRIGMVGTANDQDPSQKHSAGASDANSTLKILKEELVRFSSKVFDLVREPKSNKIISPYSLHVALSMLLMGSEPNSKTRQEIAAAMGYPKAKGKCAYKSFQVAHRDIAKLLSMVSEQSRVFKAMKIKDPYDRAVKYKSVPPIIDVFNMLIVNDRTELQPGYVAKLSRYFNSSIEKIVPNKESLILDKINGWAKKVGFDSKLMTQEDFKDPELALILLSAVQFEANWKNRLSSIKGVDFYNHGSKDKMVKGTQLKGELKSVKRTSYAEFKISTAQVKRSMQSKSAISDIIHKLGHLNFHAIGLPLADGAQLIILEPLDKGNGDELSKLAKGLLGSTTSIEGKPVDNLALVLRVIDSEEAHHDSLEFRIPEFKFENEINLMDVLKKLGIERAMSERAAEFEPMVKPRKNGESIYMSGAKQKAVVEVNESGLKAAAMTSIPMAYPRMNWGASKYVEVNSPFLFVVRFGELIIFMGQLVELPRGQ